MILSILAVTYFGPMLHMASVRRLVPSCGPAVVSLRPSHATHWRNLSAAASLTPPCHDLLLVQKCAADVRLSRTSEGQVWGSANTHHHLVSRSVSGERSRHGVRVWKYVWSTVVRAGEYSREAQTCRNSSFPEKLVYYGAKGGSATQHDGCGCNVLNERAQML